MNSVEFQVLDEDQHALLSVGFGITCRGATCHGVFRGLTRGCKKTLSRVRAMKGANTPKSMAVANTFTRIESSPRIQPDERLPYLARSSARFTRASTSKFGP